MGSSSRLHANERAKPCSHAQSGISVHAPCVFPERDRKKKGILTSSLILFDVMLQHDGRVSRLALKSTTTHTSACPSSMHIGCGEQRITPFRARQSCSHPLASQTIGHCLVDQTERFFFAHGCVANRNTTPHNRLSRCDAISRLPWPQKVPVLAIDSGQINFFSALPRISMLALSSVCS